jgi:hypothetical protein
MGELTSDAVPKIHPATREMLPDDPLEMQAFEVSGDPLLMLRMLVEDFARMGWGVDAILQLARDSNYQAFHGLRRAYGEAELRRRISEIVSRCGVIRIKTTETEPLSERLVQIRAYPRTVGDCPDFSESARKNGTVPFSADGSGIVSLPALAIKET